MQGPTEPVVRIVRIAAWTAVAALLASFVVADVGIGRARALETDFTDGDRSFSALGPPVRVGGRDALRGLTDLVGEPVYVDVRLPPLAFQATVTVSLADPPAGEPRLGVVLGRRGETTFPFALHPLAVVGAEDRLPLRRVTLDLRGVPREDGTVRLFLVLPGASVDRPVTLHRLRIVAERPSLGELFRRLLVRTDL